MHLDVQIDWRTFGMMIGVEMCVGLGGFLHLAYHCMKRWGFFKMCVSHFFWEGLSSSFMKLLLELNL